MGYRIGDGLWCHEVKTAGRQVPFECNIRLRGCYVQATVKLVGVIRGESS